MNRNLLPLSVLFCLSLQLAFPFQSHANEPIDYGRDVRPILAESCFQCHGPDAESREAGLRLDTDDGLQSVVAQKFRFRKRTVRATRDG